MGIDVEPHLGARGRLGADYWTMVAIRQCSTPEISGLDRVREIETAIANGVPVSSIPQNIVSSDTIDYFLKLLPSEEVSSTAQLPETQLKEQANDQTKRSKHPSARLRMSDPHNPKLFENSDLLRELVPYWPARLLALTVDEKAHKERYERRRRKRLGESPTPAEIEEFDEQWNQYWADITKTVNRHTLDAIKQRWGNSKDTDPTMLEFMHRHLKEASGSYNALVTEVFPHTGSLNQRNLTEWNGKYPSDVVKTYARAKMKGDRIGSFEFQRNVPNAVYSADHSQKREKDALEAKLSQIQQLLDREIFVGDIEPVTIRAVYDDETNEVRETERPGIEFPTKLKPGRHIKKYSTFQRTIEFQFSPEEARKLLEYYQVNKTMLQKRGIFITEDLLDALISEARFTFKATTNPDSKERGSVLEKGTRKAAIRAEIDPEDDEFKIEDVTDNERMEIMVRGNRTDAFLVGQKLKFILCNPNNQVHLANTDISGRFIQNLDGTLKGRVLKVVDDPNTNGNKANSKEVVFERIQIDVDGLEDDIESKVVSDTDFFMQKYHVGRFKRRDSGFTDAASYDIYKLRRRRKYVIPKWIPKEIFPHVQLTVEEIETEKATAKNLLETREDAA